MHGCAYHNFCIVVHLENINENIMNGVVEHKSNGNQK